MKVRFALLVTLCALLSPPLWADAQSEPWIAKARAALGSEQALQAVNSIHFSGTLDSIERVPDEKDATKTVDRPLRLAIDIIFQKPYQQRLTLRSEKVSRVTALDNYDGWMQRTPDLASPNNWLLDFLPPAEIKRLRANTWENLFFFRGIEKRGGKVTFEGEAKVDGKDCVKLRFEHDPEIYFVRYFDRATGRLVKTETENGAEIREEGEIMAGGLRFPKKLISKAPQGVTTTITFDTVTVNETLSPEQFAVPTLISR